MPLWNRCRPINRSRFNRKPAKSRSMSVDAKSSYLRFWGKAGGDQPSEPGWHPVAYHCLDVAAVADLLLFASPRKLARLTGLLGTSADNARRFLVS
jgi:Cas3, HD domain